jgi:hypothetical protein
VQLDARISIGPILGEDIDVRTREGLAEARRRLARKLEEIAPRGRSGVVAYVAYVQRDPRDGSPVEGPPIGILAQPIGEHVSWERASAWMTGMILWAGSHNLVAAFVAAIKVGHDGRGSVVLDVSHRDDGKQMWRASIEPDGDGRRVSAFEPEQVLSWSEVAQRAMGQR